MSAKAIALSMDDLEKVIGGADPVETAAACGVGAILGGSATGTVGICLGLAAGPFGWLVLAGAAVGGAAYGTYYALTGK